MGRIVIACYRPKEGKTRDLRELLRTHVNRLRAENLVTDRAPILAQALDGTFVEIFEWRSEDAIEQAHSNANVLKMWDEFADVCEYVPLAQIPEAADLFSEFRAVAPG